MGWQKIPWCLNMPVLLISIDLDGHCKRNSGVDPPEYAKEATLTELYVGASKTYEFRTFLRFSLASLPSGVNVTLVRLKINVMSEGGGGHSTDFHAYNVNGQADPCADSGQTLWDRCGSGNLYIDNSFALQNLGIHWLDLGPQACIDVQDAKAAVDRFSVALHEEGDNTARGTIEAQEHSNTGHAQLEITYEEEAPPPIAKIQYSDGLVCVSVG